MQSVLWQVHNLFWSEFSEAFSLILQYSVVSLSSTSSRFRLLIRLAIIPILPSIFPSIICLRRLFLRKTWPTELAFLLVIVCRITFVLRLHTILHFSHDQSKWSSTSFSSTPYKNIQGTSDIFSELFSFQHHTRLRFKCITLLIPSLNLSPNYWWKSFLWNAILPQLSWN